MQDKILKLLRSSRKALTSKQVSTKLKIDRNSTIRKLNKLVKFRMVRKTPHLDENGHFNFRFSTRTKK